MSVRELALSSLRPRRTAQVVELLAEELDQMGADGIGADELARAKGQITGSFALGLEDTSSRMGRLGTIELVHGRYTSVDETLERIGRVWDAISGAEGFDMVGFCLDTCHAHAGGNALETIVDDVRAITGRIDLVHANDSRDTFDSGADRHTNLGAGHIAPGDLADVVRAAGAPVVVETPGGAQAQSGDLAWLRERL